MPIKIREHADADWLDVCRIHDVARLDELRPTVGLDAFLTLEQTFEEGLFDGDVWVAELDGRIVGFLALSGHEITWTYVDPATYRRGVAREMLRYVMTRASAPLELEVLAGDGGARATYESLGFVVISTSTGKLAGNESFTVTGHMMRWEPNS